MLRLRRDRPGAAHVGHGVIALVYFPFITNRTEALELAEAEHCQHAVVELPPVPRNFAAVAARVPIGCGQGWT